MEIIYEDNDVLALNKPAGIVVHPDKFHPPAGGGTLVEEILKKYPEIKGVGEDPERPGIVHRLDKDTSGVILIAKNQKAFEFLKKQFQERKIWVMSFSLRDCGNLIDKIHRFLETAEFKFLINFLNSDERPAFYLIQIRPELRGR